MGKMIYFDIAAFGILAMLFASIMARKLTKGRVNNYFIVVLLIALITTVADIVAVALDNHGSGNIVLKYISHTMYLFFHNLTTPLIITYIVALTDTWHKIERHPVLKRLLIVPICLIGGSLIINFFYPVIFYLDENDAYTRGPGFFLLYISATVYILIGLHFVMAYRRSMRKHRFFSCMAIFPLMIAAIVVQMLMPGMIVEMFANALGLLGVALVIQRPEERMDTVTGFGNLNAYTQDMRGAFYNRKDCEVVLLSILNYQSLWDMLGYENTENLLKLVSVKLDKLFRGKRVGKELYNLGRGDFAVVLSRKYCEEVHEKAKLLYDELKAGFLFESMEVNLVSNVCIVHCPEDAKDVSQLLAIGEELHKQAGIGDVIHAGEFFRQDRYNVKTKIDRIIEKAIVEHKFEVYYQPIYSVEEKRFNSAEALLRLKDEEFGFISPEIFIPAAEKSGAIHRIGSYVLEEVCSFIGSDDFKNLGIDYVEINLSVQQCMQKNLASDVLATMEKYQVSADKINLEITETAAAYSQNIFLKNLNTLEKAGVKFSLDDYGTGYSNMKRIATLPLHIVKLDKTFTAASNDAKMRIVVQNTVRMIKDMQMKIVVEGIETLEMVQFFSDLQCEYIQGFYYSKPIPKSEFVEFIRKAS